MKYIAFIFFIWVVGAFMGAMLDNSFVTAADQATINEVSGGVSIVHMPVSGGQDIQLPKPNTNFFVAIYNAATFNFTFLHGGWAILKWIVFGPLAAMMAYGLIMTFINLLQKTF
jgi:hypothetical protein